MTTCAVHGPDGSRRGPRRPRARRGPPAPAAARPRASGGASWSRTPPSPPSTSSCCTPSGSPTTTLRRRLAQRAAGHPGRRRRLAGLVLRPGRPLHDRRGLLRPAPVRPAGHRPAHGPRARRGAGRRRGQPDALLHQALARGAGPLPVVGAAGAAARDDPAAGPRAPMSPYRFASWARGTFVALMIVLSRNPTFPQPVGLDELFLEPPGRGPAPRPKTPGPWTPVLTRSLSLARLYNRRPIRAAAAPGRGARGALDRGAPGGRRRLGRDPAALGLLDPGPARAGVAARPPGDRARAGRVRRRVPPGPRRRRAPAHPGLPVARLGHRAGGRRPGRRRRGPRRPGPGRRGRVAAGQGGDAATATGTTFRGAAARAAGRSSSRTRTTPTPTTPPRCCSRCAAPATRPRTRRSGAASSGCWRCRAATAAGARSTSTTTAAVDDPDPALRLRRGHRPAHRGRHRPRRRGAGRVRPAAPAPGGAARRGLPLAHPARRRLVVGALGREPRLRHRRGAPRPGGRGRGHGRPARAAGRGVARRPPERATAAGARAS